MRKRASLVLIIILLASPAFAAVSGGGIHGVFWDKLKARLQLVEPAVPSTTEPHDALGHDATDDLYWKGREEPTSVPEAELAAFNLALQAVVDGNREEAVKGFKDFLAQYPQSALADDARAALSELGSDKVE